MYLYWNKSRQSYLSALNLSSTGFLRVVPHGHQPQPSLQEGRPDFQPWARPAALWGWVGGAAGGGSAARRGGGRRRWRGSDRGRDGEVRARMDLFWISNAGLLCADLIARLFLFHLCSGITMRTRSWIITRQRVWTWMTSPCRSCRLEPGPAPRRPWGGETGSRASAAGWGEDCSTVRSVVWPVYQHRGKFESKSKSA